MIAVSERKESIWAVRPLRPFGRGWYSVRFKAMGTGCGLCFAAESEEAAEAFRAAAFQRLAQIEERVSRFIPDSVVSNLNRNAGGSWVDLDPDSERLLDLCDEYCRRTEGLFDPTSLPLLRLWDYHAPEPRVPSPAEIAAAQSLVGWARLERAPGKARLPLPGMGIDLGGIGKEYAVDELIRLAVAQGIGDVIVDLGHDLRVLGNSPQGSWWRVGVEDPGKAKECWGGLALTNLAVTTSGDYLRHFTLGGKRYGHIVDPRTGCPVTHGCRSVTVLAPDCVEAGVLATTAFILGAEAGIALIERFPHAAGCVLTEAGRLDSSRFEEYLLFG